MMIQGAADNPATSTGRRIRPTLCGCAVLVLGLAVLSLLRDPEPPPGFLRDPLWVATMGGMLVAVGLFVVVTAGSSGRRTRALVRLDHFLHFMRKKKQRETLATPPLVLRCLQRILPRALFSDRLTGRPGLVRRWLKSLGPTVASSPARRVIQAVCFAAFLVLFFHVCWPYHAQPLPPTAQSAGWRVGTVAADTATLELQAEPADRWLPEPGDTVFLADDAADRLLDGLLGALVADDVAAERLVLRPARRLSESELDRLLTSPGPWTLYDRSPWPAHYTDDLARKEWIPADLFLVIDPLVSLSTAIAARSWVWSLACGAVILIVCVLVPRGFCGYLCPLGTLIDFFDWAVAGRVKRFRVPDDGWWVHLKYYLLAGTLACATFGVLVSGFVAAIPVITRGMLFLGEPVQSGLARGWHQVPAINAGHVVSVILFLAVLALGFLKPRFWCKYVCPSGAVFSIGNLFRVTQRHVESSCINCNKCVEICPFDAIKPDFTTRVTDCTLCQTCGGVCPTDAIKFVERWNRVELKVLNDPPTGETVIGRRGFVSLGIGTAASIAGAVGFTGLTRAFGARLGDPSRPLPVRPPGSVPEGPFLDLCIRCGECFKACPYNVLQPMSFQQGLEGLWTPQVVADHAGCAPSCNACGQVCPTGAIRALALDEKRVARMGLAIVNPQTCLPLAGREACQLCVDECVAAGYDAIEFTRVHTRTDEDGEPIEGSGFVAPVVLADRCVGCGLCQMSCFRENVGHTGKLAESAIVVVAGPQYEDRIMTGSYQALRDEEARSRRPRAGGEYSPPGPSGADGDPFGTSNGPPASPPASDPFGIQ